jgi:hypothetical protein
VEARIAPIVGSPTVSWEGRLVGKGLETATAENRRFLSTRRPHASRIARWLVFAEIQWNCGKGTLGTCRLRRCWNLVDYEKVLTSKTMCIYGGNCSRVNFSRGLCFRWAPGRCAKRYSD